MSVKWRGDGDRALGILKAANIKDLESSALGATFSFDGDTSVLDELLKMLVVQGVRISEWRATGDDLEQIFLQSGAKELM